jgi:hypothetical protein
MEAMADLVVSRTRDGLLSNHYPQAWPYDRRESVSNPAETRGGWLVRGRYFLQATCNIEVIELSIALLRR